MHPDGNAAYIQLLRVFVRGDREGRMRMRACGDALRSLLCFAAPN
jgi:hypothetical protein